MLLDLRWRKGSVYKMEGSIRIAFESERLECECRGMCG